MVIISKNKKALMDWAGEKADLYIKDCFYTNSKTGRTRLNFRDPLVLKSEKEVVPSDADKAKGKKKEWVLVTSQKYEAVTIAGDKLDFGVAKSAPVKP